MDDDEDYEALFFAECKELLVDLQEHLDALSDGSADPETVNAAFRAVHSVKGGAAAFGFNHLISFAHVFETLMDQLRSGKRDITPEACALLTRAGDAMEVLIEHAQERTEPTDPLIGRTLHDLEEMAELTPSQPVSDPVAGAAKAEDDHLSGPDTPAQAPPRTVIVQFAPGEDFYAFGHDALRLIRSAKALGLSGVEMRGDVPALGALTLDHCPFAWTLTFETDEPPEVLQAFFEFYEMCATVTIEDAGTNEDEQSVQSSPPVAEPAKATDPASERKAPSPKAAEPAPPANGTAPKVVAKTLRVELARIDRLVNLVGEIVITQASLAQQLTQAEMLNDLSAAHSVEAMSRQTRELQESVMAIRAQPVKSVFSRMPRVVRDLADKLGKETRLVISGEHTEVDTTVIEELAEPLTHMLRNSMDHGIESPDKREALGKPRTGTIHLSAEHRGERVIIILTDDGAGVNRERVMEKALEKGLVSEEDNLSPEDIDQLIFHPGFSTAAEISNVSGRGVGMDVVKKKIQTLGGRCALKSEPGKGTKFIITLPLTLAVLDGMTIVVGKEKFIIPLSSVVEAVRVGDTRIEDLPDGGQMLAIRGDYIRLMSLRQALGVAAPLPETDPEAEPMAIIVDTESDGHLALLVDELIGQRQVVLKSLEANFKRVEGVSGATILGDGRVALILDVPALPRLGRSDPTLIRETVH